MGQISKKTSNTKCRLFLKVEQLGYLAAGVYLSEDPYPPPSRYTLYALYYLTIASPVFGVSSISSILPFLYLKTKRISTKN
jgi:hypothetical protein